MTTATPVLTDLLDAIVNRLSDIATELRSDLSSPALAEVRAAARATERAFVLLSPWVPHTDAAERDDIMAVVERATTVSVGMPDFAGAIVETSTLDGGNFVRVTMPRCVYLLEGEADPVDDEDRLPETIWSVVGRYPQ